MIMMAKDKPKKIACNLGREFYQWWENQFTLRDSKGEIIQQIKIGEDFPFDLYWDGTHRNRFDLKLSGSRHIVGFDTFGRDSRVFFFVYSEEGNLERIRKSILDFRRGGDINRVSSLRGYFGSPKFSVEDYEDNGKGVLVKSHLNKYGKSGQRNELFVYARDFYIRPVLGK